MRHLVFLCLLACATAHAQLTTVNAQDYPTGTNLMGVRPGVKVYSAHNFGTGDSYAIANVYAVANTWATGVGPNLFGHAIPYPSVSNTDFRNVYGFHYCLEGLGCDEPTWEFFNPLRVDFAAPTNYVEVRAHFARYDIDGADLRAYNSRGELLSICHFFGDSPGRNPRLKPLATGAQCGELVRRYDCDTRGTSCKSEHLGRIKRAYPDIAFVTYGGESYYYTRASASQVTFRRFSDECRP